jgi:hypothetical protein
MPVTTRLQAKHLLERCSDHLITSLFGSSTTLSTSTMSMSNTDFPIITMQASDMSDHRHVLLSSLPSSILPSNDSFSHFQNLEISNPLNFDPVYPHNFAVLNFSIMEADCQDNDGTRNESPKSEESSDLNNVLSVLTAHVTASTTKMSSDFYQVISANDNFKQEVREANDNFQREIRKDIFELRSLLHQQ